MRRMSGTVTFFCSMRKRPPRTDGPGGRQVRCPGEAGGVSWSPIPVAGALGVGHPLTFVRAVRCVPSRSVSIPARRGSGSLPGSKRNVVLHPLSHGPDLLDQVGEVAAVLDEVDVRAIDHQEWGLGVLVKVAPERLRQSLQVLWPDTTLELPITLPQPPQQHIRTGLEIDDEIRPR